MTWSISIGVALLSGILGLLSTALISNACVSWYSIPSREGLSGYFVLFNAIGGGIAGCFIGFITARVIAVQNPLSFGKQLGGALAVILVLAGVATLLCRFLADVPPTMDGRKLNVEVEFRFPSNTDPSQPPTAMGDWKVQLDSIAGRTHRTSYPGEINTQSARLESGRWIVPAEVFLFTERGKRSLVLSDNDNHIFGFLLPLPARPGRPFLEWSEWLPRQQSDGSEWPAEKMSCRFRIVQFPLPPPRPSEAEYQAEQRALAEEQFASIPADAPVQEWFPYLSYEQPQTERARELIAGRPNLREELSALALGDDGELAGAALRCISELPATDDAWNVLTQSAGRDIAERIRRFNATSVEADPSYTGAADVSYRFHGWMQAVRALREKAGGDFIPELQIILELSRVREDSHVMQADIRRVASYYLHQWAGIQPHPGDPKPR